LPAFQERSLQKTLPLIRVLREIAEGHRVVPAQVALRWVIQFHGDGVVAIPGAQLYAASATKCGRDGF
jgi:aryl-alcohol dehydrogenase-like predicted oxidoreductase